jgi:hypothetical protein
MFALGIDKFKQVFWHGSDSFGLRRYRLSACRLRE